MYSLDMSKDTPDRIAMRRHVIEAHSYLHLGIKSKQVLEQELWSLFNRSGSIMTTKENQKWVSDVTQRLTEYKLRFGDRNWLADWNKWAKSN